MTDLRSDASRLERDLKELLVYYGEKPDSSEGLKPEDFFGLVMSFSSSLQVTFLKHLDMAEC